MGAYWVGGLSLAEENVVCLVSRQGRQLQRYSKNGRRLVVGCIPYRFKDEKLSDEGVEQVVEVLVISSQKGHGMMFPKGGWEVDETRIAAVSREAMEEAGVRGDVEDSLGRWTYKSKRYDSTYEVIMFPLNVTEELDLWPEKDVRKRRWVSVAIAKEGCQHSWMKEALERFMGRLLNSSRQENISA